ncbi:MAG: hypothetical protein IJA26_00320 [Clostridia bacterium]|nr:hypothetical protein [Clostridia bacterium]
MSLKDNWKQTGVGLGHAFRDLGKSVIKSVATGVKKADNWANKEDSVENSAAEKAEETAVEFVEEAADKPVVEFVENTEQGE